MKRFALGILAVVILALPACAQPATAAGDIPFAFVAGHTTMPAGHYVITLSNGSYMAEFEGSEPHAHVLLNSVRAEVLSDSDQPRLTFNRYGNQYFLSAVSSASKSCEFPVSRLEREAKQSASAADASQVIVLAMR